MCGEKKGNTSVACPDSVACSDSVFVFSANCCVFVRKSTPAG